MKKKFFELYEKMENMRPVKESRKKIIGIMHSIRDMQKKWKILKIKSSGYDLISNKDHCGTISLFLQELFSEYYEENQKVGDINKKINSLMSSIAINQKEFKKAKEQYNLIKELVDNVMAMRRKFVDGLFEYGYVGYSSDPNGVLNPINAKGKKLFDYLADFSDLFSKEISNYYSNLNLASFGIPSIVPLLPSVRKSYNENHDTTEITRSLSSSFNSIISIFYLNLTEKAQKKSSYYNGAAKKIDEILEIINKEEKNLKLSEELKGILDDIRKNMKLEHDHLLTKNLSNKKIRKNLILESENEENRCSHEVEKALSNLMVGTAINGVNRNNLEDGGILSAYDLFGCNPENWIPKIEDIRQGNSGDCYLMSALLTLCKTLEGALQVKKCFSNINSIDKDGKLIMSFHKLEIFSDISGNFTVEPKGTVFVSITPSLLLRNSKVQGAMSNKGSLWVNMIEKAFIKYLSTVDNIACKDPFSMLYINILRGSHLTSFPSLTNISGGRSSIPLAAVTGQSYCLANKFDVKMITQFANATIIFNPEAIKSLENRGFLESGHIYAISGHGKEEGKDCLYLINPHQNAFYNLTCLKDNLSEVTDDEIDDNLLKIVEINETSPEFIEYIDNKLIDDFMRNGNNRDKAEDMLKNLKAGKDGYEMLRDGKLYYVKTNLLHELGSFNLEKRKKEGKTIILRVDQLLKTPNLINAIDYMVKK